MLRGLITSLNNIHPEEGLDDDLTGSFLSNPRLGVRAITAAVLAVVFLLLWKVELLPSLSVRALILLCGLEILSLPVYHFLTRKFGKPLLQLYCRWFTDILIITVAIHFLGGEQAFAFSFSYCLVIFSTSMVLRIRGSILVATFCAACFMSLLYLEYAGKIHSPVVWNMDLGAEERWLFPVWIVIFFFLTAYFSSTLSERLRQRKRILEVVNTISLISSSSLALQEILDRVLNFTLEHFNAEAGVARLTKQWLDMKSMSSATRDLPEEIPEKERISMDGLVTRLMDEKEPVIIRDLETDPMSRHMGIRWIKSLIAAPICHKGECVGGFVLFNKKSARGDQNGCFRKEDLDLLTTITRQIAPAIVNARLYTNLEDANRSIRKAQDQIVKTEKFEALGEMITGLGHQFRNPLLAIGAAAKRLAKGERIPENLRFYVQIIQSETQKLEKILKDVPGLHIGNECSRREVDVNILIERALSLVFENGGNKEISIERNFGEWKDPLPSVDPDQLEVALYNIFCNAGEAMGSKGRLSIQSRLVLSSEGRILSIEISDTGGGIPPEDVDNIFNPFYTTKHWGTGLGLSMTHRIVENHGGDIHVLNRPGEGVTFRISIPNA